MHPFTSLVVTVSQFYNILLFSAVWWFLCTKDQVSRALLRIRDTEKVQIEFEFIIMYISNGGVSPREFGNVILASDIIFDN